VTYKNEELELVAKLITTGYIHKFHVDIQGTGVYFEPDEERHYRAILDEEAIEKNLKPNVELIKLISNKIEELFSGK
jgi:hypothetical protein